MADNDHMIEAMKDFLIVGESIEEICAFREIRRINILMSLSFLVATIYSIGKAISVGIYWYYLAFSFTIGLVYYIFNSRVSTIYAITKFRIIRIEQDFLSTYFFQRSAFLGFSDLHYEHCESINIGPPIVKVPQIYVSVFGITIGWVLVVTIPDLSLLPAAENLLQLVAILIIVLSLVNLFFALPIGGVRLVVQSISGTTMEFPEKHIPETFASKLLVNCRTFLSYGAT